jgi:hypothetical protein
VLLSRRVLGHTALSGQDAEKLIPYLHAALDAVAMDPDARTNPRRRLGRSANATVAVVARPAAT